MTGLDAALETLAAAAARLVDEEAGRGAGAVVTTSVDCRYRGQSHELRVPSVASFGEEHLRRNGTIRPDDPVEVTALRAVVETPAPARIEEVLASWDGRWRGSIVGPVIVEREDCTIWVPLRWRGEPGPLGSLVLRRVDQGPDT